MRHLELVGFRPEHWGYDWPDCYAEFENKLLSVATTTEVKDGYLCNAVTIPNSLLLAGNVGTGKTVMLAILCKALYATFSSVLGIDAGADLFAKPIKYCTHGELTKTWEHEFDDNSNLPTEDYFKTVPILFLDDLFSGQVNPSGRNIAKLEEFIDWRWSKHLRTIIATNISLKDLWKPANKQYHRIARRLSEKKWIYYQPLTHKFTKPEIH